MQQASSPGTQIPPFVRAGLARIVEATRAGAGYAVAAGRHIEAVRPLYIVGPLVLVQWGVTAALGLAATHNGWLFYHGGDGTYYWTTTWSLAHHRIPEAVISYGLPVALWPLGLVYGTSMLSALPAVIAFQVLLLAPLGVVAMFGLASRIAGRLFGYFAVAAWILAPLVGLLWFYPAWPTFRPYVHDLVVPNALGLTTLADYTSMILALTTTWLVVRVLDDRRWNDVVLAGLSAGTLIAVKPSNAYFFVAPVLMFGLSRRWREGAAFLLLLVPALITLTIWKQIGLGHVPLASPPTTQLATGSSLVAGVPVPSLHRYFPFDWGAFQTNLNQLREVGWSLRFVEWLSLAGMIGLIRRAPAVGVGVGAWFLSYVFFKGGAAGISTVYSTSFFRFVMPAFPAFVLLVVSVVFLVPGVRRRSIPETAPKRPTRVAVVAVALLAAYPLAFVATAKAWGPGHVVKYDRTNVLVPVSSTLTPTVAVHHALATLSWRRPRHGSTVVYFQVYRSADAGCVEHTTGASDCSLTMTPVGLTQKTTFVDPDPVGAGATYRIGLLAGWKIGRRNTDLLLLSPSVRAAAR